MFPPEKSSLAVSPPPRYSSAMDGLWAQSQLKTVKYCRYFIKPPGSDQIEDLWGLNMVRPNSSGQN